MLARGVFGARLALAEDEDCENLMIFKNEVDMLCSQPALRAVLGLGGKRTLLRALALFNVP